MEQEHFNKLKKSIELDMLRDYQGLLKEELKTRLYSAKWWDGCLYGMIISLDFTK